MKHISSYQVFWAEITPSKGIVTKHDRKAFGDLTFIGVKRKYFKPFVNKDCAMRWIENFKKKLDKKYTVRLFTDKQFSMATRSEGELIIPFTKKQKEEVYIIK